MKEIHRNIGDFPFSTIRNMCLHVTTGKLRNGLRVTNSVDEIFDLLEENPLYCNWMNIRLLEVIAISSDHKHLIKLIQDHKESVYSRPLKQVLESLPNFKVKTTQILSKYKNLNDDMKVQELFTFNRKLANELAYWTCIYSS